MTFQSSNSNLQVSQEVVTRKTDFVANNIPVFAADKKLIDSTVPVGLVSSAEQSANKAVANGYASLDADGKVPIIQLPNSAFERLVIVADQAARFALTIADVQNGDSVKQNDTGLMYFVSDDTNLNNAAGYTTYKAITDWASVSGIPANIVALSLLVGTSSQYIRGDMTLATIPVYAQAFSAIINPLAASTWTIRVVPGAPANKTIDVRMSALTARDMGVRAVGTLDVRTVSSDADAQLMRVLTDSLGQIEIFSSSLVGTQSFMYEGGQ